MNKLSLIGTLLIFFAACEKDQISRYDLGHYVYFTQTQDQDTTLSFSHYPGNDRHSLKYEVSLTGYLLDKPLAFKLEVVDSLTTASADQYELDLNPVFGVGQSTDTITITLIKNVALKGKDVTLVVAVVPNENFEPGFPGKRYITIHYNDRDYQPLWWNTTFAIYFGDYTPTKFREMTLYFKRSDFSGIEEPVLRKYALEFKTHVKDNNLTEPDGSVIVIPVR